MLIDAITVSAGYADFLAETLPVNLPHLNRLVVVTCPDDRETMEVCKHFSVECRATNLMTTQGAKFAKARGIDYGLAFLASTNWIVHFDADIAFPPDMRRALPHRPMNPKYLYGADRVYCNSFEDWRAHLATHRHQHKFHYRIDPPRFDLGARIAIRAYDGYLPIGYFQLWHGSTGRRYPTTQQDGAEHTDVLHAIQWDAEERHLLPDFFVVHLDSAPSAMGSNWKGRRTPRFGPARPQSRPGPSY